MHISDGKKLTVTAAGSDLIKDVPVLHGQLLIVPSYTIKDGEVGTARYSGLFDGPIKAGDSPAFMGEPAFFDAENNSFTKTAPTVGVIDAVGVFIDNGVLLTGQLLTIKEP